MATIHDPSNTPDDGEIHEFTVSVGDDVLDDLHQRLADARLPDQLPDSGWSLGTDVTWLADTAEYWRTTYDWRAAEERLNRLGHHITVIDGQPVHFVHERSSHADALPLVVTHGWPGSVVEFLDLYDLLTGPDEGGQAFHVVTPSLPGYAWSGPTREAGWNLRRTAEAWAVLMERLGYDRYGAQGGDWGSFVTQHLAHVAPDAVVGAHVNMLMALPPGGDDDLDDLTEREAAQLERSQRYFTEGNGYMSIQSTKPQTLAYGLHDSPVGLLAWIGEKFHGWTDHDGDLTTAVDLDHLLTNVTVYWVTGTIASSVRYYHENLTSGAVAVEPITHLPLGVANFPAEILAGRRRWAEATHRLEHWTDMPRGGHFAAMEAPEFLAEDLRTFFAPLR